MHGMDARDSTVMVRWLGRRGGHDDGGGGGVCQDGLMRCDSTWWDGLPYTAPRRIQTMEEGFQKAGRRGARMRQG
jgi:hypothetical protein